MSCHRLSQWRIQNFPEEGAPTIRVWTPTYYFVQLSPKTAWKWKNLDREEGHPWRPPWIRQCIHNRFGGAFKNWLDQWNNPLVPTDIYFHIFWHDTVQIRRKLQIYGTAKFAFVPVIPILCVCENPCRKNSTLSEGRTVRYSLSPNKLNTVLFTDEKGSGESINCSSSYGLLTLVEERVRMWLDKGSDVNEGNVFSHVCPSGHRWGGGSVHPRPWTVDLPLSPMKCWH